jgi:hypothetical protein
MREYIRVGSARDDSVKYLVEDVESTTVEHSGAEGVGVDDQLGTLQQLGASIQRSPASR